MWDSTAPCVKCLRSSVKRLWNEEWNLYLFAESRRFPMVRLMSLVLLAAGSLAAASAQNSIPLLPPVQHEVLFHGSRGQKRVALTFDACATGPRSRYDDRITRILIDTRTRATLFLGGRWMEDHAQATRQLAADSLFELGNHTYLHPHLTTLADDAIREELSKTQQIMYRLTDRQPHLFRAPYGEYDERVVRIAGSLGLITVQYDLPSGDPDTLVTKERLIDYVASSARNGSIIVMHINRRGWHTAEALPEIIRRLRARGFALVTVGELLGTSHP